MLDQERDARRLAKTPRPSHYPNHYRPPVYYPLPPYGYYLPSYGYGYGYGVSSSTTYVTPTYETPTPPVEPLVETGFLKLEVEPRQMVQFSSTAFTSARSPTSATRSSCVSARAASSCALPAIARSSFDTENRSGSHDHLSRRARADPRPLLRPLHPLHALHPLHPMHPRPPAGSRVIYVIPGCYMGNVSPMDIALRPGCDISKLTTISPQ
jgi:hypothetical protein